MGKVATEATLQTAVELLGVISRGGWSFDLEPEAIARIARSGHAADVFDIGDVIYIPWTYENKGDGSDPVTYQYPFVVADIRDGIGEGDKEFHNGIILQGLQLVPGIYTSDGVTANMVTFDASEQVPCPEGTEIEDGFYYYYQFGDSFYAVDPAPTVGSVVPEGMTYYKHDLPNAGGAIRNGLNDYSWSAARQWLNSDAAAGAGWWTAQHPCDVAPSEPYLGFAGFMHGFANAWKEIFKPVRVGHKRNTTSFSGEAVYTYDTFFYPSLSELNASVQYQAIEGAPWQYWKDLLGPTPVVGATDKRFFAGPESATGMNYQSWRTRTAVANKAQETHGILKDDGRVYNSLHANNAARVLPCTVIY